MQRAQFGGSQHFFKLASAHPPVVGAAQHPAIFRQDLSSKLRQLPEILFHTENLSLFIPRERRRINDDPVELPPLFREPSQPVENVPLAEMMSALIQAVVPEVSLRPVQINRRQIQSRRLRPTHRARDREATGVGKQIQQPAPAPHPLPHLRPVQPLIQKNTLRIAGLKRHFEIEPVLLHQEWPLDLRPVKMQRRFLLMLIQPLPVDRAPACFQPVLDTAADLAARRHGHPVPRIFFQREAAHTIPGTIHQPQRVRPILENLRPFRHRNIQKNTSH